MESTSVPPRPRGRVKLPHPLYTLWQRMPDTPRNEQTLAAPAAAESPPPLVWANVLMFALSFAGALILVPWYGLTHGFSPAAWAACVLLAGANGMAVTAGHHRPVAARTPDAHRGPRPAAPARDSLSRRLGHADPRGRAASRVEPSHHLLHQLARPHVGQPAVHRREHRARQPGHRGRHLRRGLSQLPPHLRARLPQRRALVAVGSDQVAHRGAAGGGPHAPSQAHTGLPDPARPARHAVHARPRAPREQPPCPTLAPRAAARARGARVRELPRSARGLVPRQGSMARREEARRERALGAAAASGPLRPDRAPPEPAAAAHARPAGATRLSAAARGQRPFLRHIHPSTLPRGALARAPAVVHHAGMGRIFEVRKATMFARWNRMAKQFARIAKDLTMAVKAGGADPASNPTLRRTIQNARAGNMPKDKIEAALKQAAGRDATPST